MRGGSLRLRNTIWSYEASDFLRKPGVFFLCLEVRKSNVFEAVKESVTTRQAAEYYGVQVGRNGMACCPFHDDKHPSMKVDRRFHCFGCQADGDVIDFTARLFGLSGKEAALKLAEDFSVRYDAKGHDPPRRRPVKRKISEELRYRQAEQKCFRVLCDYLHLLERWEKKYAPQTPEEAWNPLFVEALQKKPYTEYLLDILLSGSMEERASVVAEYGKEVRKIEQRISEFTASHPAGRHERSRSLSAGAERLLRCGKACPSPRRASPPTPSATAGRCSAMTLSCVGRSA